MKQTQARVVLSIDCFFVYVHIFLIIVVVEELRRNFQKKKKMVAFGGLVATFAAVSWAFVYAFTQDILVGMTPINLLTATYVFSGILSLLPFAVLGDVNNFGKSIAANPGEFAAYTTLVVLGKFFMIYSVKLIGATAAGLVEISYVSGLIAFLFHVRYGSSRRYLVTATANYPGCP